MLGQQRGDTEPLHDTVPAAHRTPPPDWRAGLITDRAELYHRRRPPTSWTDRLNYPSTGLPDDSERSMHVVRLPHLPPKRRPSAARWRAVALGLALAWAVTLLLLWPGAARAQTVILYAHADAPAAQRAQALARVYGPVTIDRCLPPGTPWRRTMGRAIAGARVVLVLWSATAAQSPELGAEWRLALAARRPRVIAVMLDDAPLPGELAAVQAVDWRPGPGTSAQGPKIGP